MKTSFKKILVMVGVGLLWISCFGWYSSLEFEEIPPQKEEVDIFGGRGSHD